MFLFTFPNRVRSTTETVDSEETAEHASVCICVSAQNSRCNQTQ
jgi:hypothetical protein